MPISTGFLIDEPVLCRDAVEFLVNEGFVYSTIDDDHYRSTMG
jgi:hypothetical protein